MKTNGDGYARRAETVNGTRKYLEGSSELDLVRWDCKANHLDLGKSL